MALTLVGIVDYNDQVHCLEHAYTVGSYRFEVYSVDPGRTCWCGAKIGNQEIVPHPSVWPNYIDRDRPDADHTVTDVWGDYIERDI